MILIQIYIYIYTNDINDKEVSFMVKNLTMTNDE
jgi:hypothetical protein